VADTGRTGCLLEILVLQAMAHHLHRQTNEAMTTLEQALELAEPETYTRLFIDAGRPMAELLQKRKAEDGGMKQYIDKLLSAFDNKNFHPSSLLPQPLLDPLSERELELLQLIAAGMSNQEVAADLVLTVGTVKWHLSNIYSKLGVSSRTQAVARARELRLL
jgi:LuxR family maltose regulon positive regulatory protein